MNIIITSKKGLVFICLLSLFSGQIFSKILIITTAFNRPDFIEIQDATFKRFLQDDYEFKVFNDANNPEMEQKIKDICGRLDIPCIRVPQESHFVDPKFISATASFRVGDSIQFAMKDSGFQHNDIVAIVDSDLFLIRNFSIRNFLGNNHVYGWQNPVENRAQIVPPLSFFNMPELINPEQLNFHAGSDGNTFFDCTELTKIYFYDHPEIRWKTFDNISLCFTLLGLSLKEDDVENELIKKGYSVKERKLIKSVLDYGNEHNKMNPLSICNIGFFETNIFLHYSGGSNWLNLPPRHKIKKDELIKNFINSILNDEQFLS